MTRFTDTGFVGAIKFFLAIAFIFLLFFLRGGSGELQRNIYIYMIFFIYRGNLGNFFCAL